jgi:hypothetical protein
MVIQGATASDNTGKTVANAGDVNGDNISDLVVGAQHASPLSRINAGAAYMIYGSKTLPAMLDLQNFTALQGIVIQGAAAGDHAAGSVANAGDINGDNLPDLVVGAQYVSPLNRSQAGAMYVIYGSKTLPAILDLQNFTALQGIVVQGAAASDNAGQSVSGIGDINGDGKNDFLIGAPYASPQDRSGAGEAYLIYSSFFSTTAMTTTSEMTGALSSTRTQSGVSQTVTSNQSGATSSSVSSASASGGITTETETSTQETIAPAKSGGNGAVIGAAVGGVVGGIALTACLAGIGFYAYKKKSRSNTTNNTVLTEQAGTPNKIDSYQQLPLAPVLPNYGKIDAMKKNENDEVPKLEI